VSSKRYRVRPPPVIGTPLAGKYSTKRSLLCQCVIGVFDTGTRVKKRKRAEDFGSRTYFVREATIRILGYHR
jgi:hypothetical protein